MKKLMQTINQEDEADAERQEQIAEQHEENTHMNRGM